MKFLYDFLPIIIFFVAYKLFGIYVATASAIVVSLLQVIYYRIRHGKFENMQLATLVLIAVLGGATLIFHDVMFIKWKVTVVNWLFAAVFFITQFVGKDPLVKHMLRKNIDLPDAVWKRLNFSWVIYFFVLGCVNLYVIYHFSTDTWVNFKLFGILGLTVVFVIFQAVYLSRHMKHDK
tara:strand:- start:16549 stop:17082 length:534 start_codon:yes stop_codon:yes gene_type:complete